MINEATIYLFVEALHGMTQANIADFCRSAPLVAAYEDAIKSKRFRYVDDIHTCGERDCWSSFRDLAARYPKGTIPLDCEDAATAHAAYLAIRCVRGVYIGLVPGNRVSHAVCGVLAEKGGTVTVIDPCRWYGMRETSYAGVRWKKVS